MNYILVDMKSINSSIFLGVLLLVLISCKKDETSKLPPVIQINSPTEGAMINLLLDSAIVIDLEISDDHSMHEASLKLFNEANEVLFGKDFPVHNKNTFKYTQSVVPPGIIGKQNLRLEIKAEDQDENKSSFTRTFEVSK